MGKNLGGCVEGSPVERTRKVGPYTLRRKLGQGGMSSVFLAEDAEGKQFALKLLNLSLESEPEFRKRFQREAEVTLRLDHPHIVKTLNWEEDPEAGLYLVMEYVPGGNLRHRLESNPEPQSLEQVLQWFRPVAEALDYAHQSGVVHRDLKPENLLFQEDGSLKIADFGVARVEQTSRLTRTGVLPGTPEYMAPEQFSGVGASPASDIYSLGILLYEALTGTTPFRSDNLAQVLQRQTFEKAGPPSGHRSNLPASVDRALLKALDKRPEQRFTRAVDLLDALAAPSASTPPARNRSNSSVISELPTRVVRWQGPARNKRLPWLLPLLLWLIGGLLWLWKLMPEPPLPGWVQRGVGSQPAAVGRQLCCSICWNGIEVALVGPTRSLAALERGRFAAHQLEGWVDQEWKPKAMKGKDRSTLAGPDSPDWIEIDAQMALNLQATPQQIGEYWAALLEDVQRLRRGTPPAAVREVERRRPLRLDGKPPLYPLLDRLYDRSRLQVRQGPLATQVLYTSLQSLGRDDALRLRQAARSVPLPPP